MEGLTLKRLRRDCPVCGFGSKKKSKKSATSAVSYNSVELISLKMIQNLPSIEIGSEEKDEENFSRNFNESDSDKDEEQNALKVSFYIFKASCTHSSFGKPRSDSKFRFTETTVENV